MSSSPPVAVSIPVAWGELDAFRHVNNTVYFRYFESARIAYFEKIGMLAFMEEHGIGPILAHTECRFRFPLTYPDTVTAEARVTEMSGDRFLMRYQVTSRKTGGVAAEGTGRVVCVDYETGRKTAIPEPLRSAICRIEGHDFPL